MNSIRLVTALFIFGSSVLTSRSAVVFYEGSGSTSAAIVGVRDSFRTAIGGGTTAAANGDFGGVRREINWDGVPSNLSDPNALPGNFFNVDSPRGVVLTTPGTGFMVSANAGGATAPLFGFANDLQAFSAQKLFTAVNSNITDVSFFVPGTTTAATTSAFGVVFVDVEVAGSTKLEFFDSLNNLIFSRDALAAGNQGLSFLGGVATGGELISRVRITSGLNTFVANGTLGSPNPDFVVMDDFIYATPTARAGSVPDTGSVSLLFALSLVGLAVLKRRGGAAA
ncbi:VPDSG-CTERM sorting domain-containing protein [Horticoccus sp. 23ND18S-11]|uniref:VPDSG-CTERM sorting domain-containing protein n=1 Tax=Horticoccus sp. 23ND18S-11 TaxID=3391832 RepID=UPI0039C9E81B